MAGTGKGALRIAIEDFFSTSKIGVWFNTWWGDFADKQEQHFLSEFTGLYAEAKKIEGLSKIVDFSSYGKGTGQHQAGITMLVSMAAGFGASIGYSLASAFMSLAQQLSLRVVLPTKLQPVQILDLERRGLLSKTELAQDKYFTGINPDRIEALTRYMEERVDIDRVLTFYRRGLITDVEAKKKFNDLWYTPKDAEKLLELAKLIPGVQDLISMAVREAWDDATAARFGYDAEYPSQVETEAKKIGLDAAWVKRYWRAHWVLPSPQQAFEMVHRLRPGKTQTPFTQTDLATLLKVADYPQYFRPRMTAISYNPYTRVDIRRMYKLGILTKDEVYQCYLDIGYDDAHAKNLADFAVKYETGTDTDKIDEYKTLSVGLIREAYTKKVIDKSTATTKLQELKYPDDEIKVILSLAEFKKTIDSTPSYIDEYTRELRNMIEKAYTSKMVSRVEATSLLTKLGLHADEIKFSLDNSDYLYLQTKRAGTIKLLGDKYVNYAADRTAIVQALGGVNITGAEQAALLDEWDTQRNLRTRRLTEAQYRTAWKRGIITETDYVTALKGLAYTDYDINILVKMAASTEV